MLFKLLWINLGNIFSVSSMGNWYEMFIFIFFNLGMFSYGYKEVLVRVFSVRYLLGFFIVVFNVFLF